MSILFDNPPPAIGCGDPGDSIPFSCRFDGAQSLTRTPDSSGSSEKFTLSFWYKRTSFASSQVIINAILTSPNRHVGPQFEPSGALTFHDFTGSTINARRTTSGLFRDPAAWGHIVIKRDASHAVEADRAVIIEDGVRVSGFSVNTTGAVGSTAGVWNASGVLQAIGRYAGGGSNYQGLMAEIILIDDEYAPESLFGYFNSDGAWVPRGFQYKGQGSAAYGPQGWHLDFADPLDLGKDVSGNGNHFTSNGLTADSQDRDTPTSNFNTFNLLDRAGDTATDGLLVYHNNGSVAIHGIRAAMPLNGGKWYWEVDVINATSGTSYQGGVGLQRSSGLVDDANERALYWHNGVLYGPGATAGSTAAFGTGNVLGFAFDQEAGTLEIFKDGVSLGVCFSGLSGSYKVFSSGYGSIFRFNFGQRPFAYAVPDGFNPVTWANAPCPEILNPDDYFTIREAGDTAPLPWNATVHKTLGLIKDRAGDTSYRVVDTIMGDGKAWAPDVDGSEINEGANGVTWTAAGPVYGSAPEYGGDRLALFWRASPKAGFDIVTIDHTTGASSTVPQMSGGVIEQAWVVGLNTGLAREFHHRLAAGQYLGINGKIAAGSDPGWISSTSNNVTLGASMPSDTYVLYVRRAVPGFSAFEKYRGQYSAGNPFVPTDFEPRAIMMQGVTTSWYTVLVEAASYPENQDTTPHLRLDAAQMQVSGVGSNFHLDRLSNGARVFGASSDVNTADVDHVVSMWARIPGKFARAV